MGMFDTVTFDSAHPQQGVVAGAIFQTKSLFVVGARFAITADGKLIAHPCHYETDGEERALGVMFSSVRQHSFEGRQIAYHGDILLVGDGADGRLLELVARFTHGRLEWLHPLSAYPAEDRGLLIE